MQKNKCESLAEKYPNTVVLQLRGGFYNAFDDSATVLSSVMGYKLKEMGTGRFKAGFPNGTADKVLTKFKELHINFVMFDNQTLVEQMAYEDNGFLSYIDSSKAIFVPMIRPEDTGKRKQGVELEMHNHQELLFLEAVCDGKDPYTLENSDVLYLNDIRTVRILHKIKGIVSQNIGRR